MHACGRQRHVTTTTTRRLCPSVARLRSHCTKSRGSPWPTSLGPSERRRRGQTCEQSFVGTHDARSGSRQAALKEPELLDWWPWRRSALALVCHRWPCRSWLARLEKQWTPLPSPASSSSHSPRGRGRRGRRRRISEGEGGGEE